MLLTILVLMGFAAFSSIAGMVGALAGGLIGGAFALYALALGAFNGVNIVIFYLIAKKFKTTLDRRALFSRVLSEELAYINDFIINFKGLKLSERKEVEFRGAKEALVELNRALILLYTEINSIYTESIDPPVVSADKLNTGALPDSLRITMAIESLDEALFQLHGESIFLFSSRTKPPSSINLSKVGSLVKGKEKLNYAP